MEGADRSFKMFETTVAGRKLTVEIGKIATLANGSCVVRYGDTAVLVTATASKKPKEGIDFFPLSVDFEEKLYAVGKIPGGFIKREGRMSEKATLTSRLIDRPIRPLFPEGYYNEVQIIASVLSIEQDNTPDTVAMIGASIALSISDIPFDGPIAATTVGYVDGQYVLNPTVEQSGKSELHLVVAGTHDAIMMVEAGSNILSEKVMLDAIMTGHDEIKRLVEFINTIVAEVGKEKPVVVPTPVDPALQAIVDAKHDEMNAAVRIHDKHDRNEALDVILDALLEETKEAFPESKVMVPRLFKKLSKKVMRKMIAKENLRPDGRKPDEIRPINCEVSYLPRTHGSGLFMRGITQALTITTLGALGEAQRIDGIGLDEPKRYMHHYNFPPFSVGETGFMRGPNRRSIGHGALGERALLPVLPSETEFPYAIRLVSEVVTCNGSSSQASICGSTLSLLDAGVPIKDSVAGIAMGLINEDDKYAILSDIQGMEDFLGDMDFKVAGTRTGITAMQMDIKVDGLSREILENALEQARIGRLHILDKMAETISEPRKELSEYAPRVFFLKVDPDRIREIIGAGGKVINRIIAETGAKIDIEDDGTVLITANDMMSGLKTKGIIEGILKEVKVGEIYNAKIVRIMKFGAFVEFANGKDGLVHISQLANERLKAVEDAFKIGDEIVVKVMEIDEKGRINLSRKVLLEQ